MEKMKFCKMLKKFDVKADVKVFNKVVKKAQFICERCGCVARKEKSLCKPVEL